MVPSGRFVVSGSLVLLVALLVGACAAPDGPDAYGNVEATSVLVSPEIGGRLVSLEVDEGARISAGVRVGAVDALHLELDRDRLQAQRAVAETGAREAADRVRALEAQQSAARAERAALEAQKDVADRAFARLERLVSQQAATSQQLEQAEREVRVVTEHITAQGYQIDALGVQIQGARRAVEGAQQHVAVVDAQIAQAEERVGRSGITNPIAGTVLATYAEPGEMVQPGQPLYAIADLSSVEVRAYVTEPQLAGLGIGRPAHVTVDAGADARRVVDGTVSWIASEAEFTPTPIQTRDERADLVYAVKIRVPNPDGILKIGMPVDVDFEPAP
jgi:HlyD family secretion protein